MNSLIFSIHLKYIILNRIAIFSGIDIVVGALFLRYNVIGNSFMANYILFFKRFLGIWSTFFSEHIKLPKQCDLKVKSFGTFNSKLLKM